MTTKGRYTKGFTLVELLVVIAIIAVMAAALFMVINPANLMKKTRDSRRISEMAEVNKAIAGALADSKLTPPVAAMAVRDSCGTPTYTVLGAGWVGGWTGTLADFMPVLPRDPKASPNVAPNCYYFTMSTLGTWELDVVLESFDNANLAINDGGTSGTAATCTAALMPSVACRYEIGTNLTLI
ncbi:MAG: prepilin-type N-terminal cleavage/methylation domain-containing protein [Patescibacteria group bacterium]